MKLKYDQKYYKEQVAICKKNIVFVEESKYTPQEKRDLIYAYRKQIRDYSSKLMSFYQGKN